MQNINGEFINVSDVRIPQINNKANKNLYDFAKELDADVLPQNYWGWQRNLRYFKELTYSYEDLAESIQEKGNISALGNSTREAKQWLKECLRFLIDPKNDICSKYKILPNQRGDLKDEDDLYMDKKLPAQLKRINEKTEGWALSNDLLDVFFNKLIVIHEYTTEDLANRIDSNIKKIYEKNKGCIPEEYESCINSLYSWTKDCELEDDILISYFPWFYPKRASLIADMMTDEQREQSLRIVRSGKMEYLSALAESDFSSEDIQSIVDNIDSVRFFLSQINYYVDDKKYANKDEGDLGEKIVWRELQKKYPSSKGYRVIWASKDNNEPRYDFRIEKNAKVICYYDAKTTARGINNADSIPFFMRKSQWLFLKDLSENTPYYIARVFIGDNDRVWFIRVSASL